MEARAITRHVGVPATKLRQLIDHIRLKPVEEALSILRFSPRPVAKVVEKRGGMSYNVDTFKDTWKLLSK